ncbi:hypothetical protein M378DRAFT_27866 [Amanita muscaria Koide BX008]|uniref:Guanine nucleotide-binding protein alpha-4 subunit n=1 Tax=Amanita muscaria (strain Koide BX008) TaxID=946122 RepID=A0A0C2S4S0_AMAMK|nr:hypothetical protein M378DRAFT_27866 [Amanita muscaria Koide BX008]
MPARVDHQSIIRSVATTSADPLSYAIRPPQHETPEERMARLRREQEAQYISDRIDEELQRQEAAERKAPKAVKVLLLGQSESGKSTTLKNFQLMYEPKAFRAERASWRAVIQLNVVRSIHLILDAIDQAVVSSYSDRTSHHPSPDLLKLKLRLVPLLEIEKRLLHRLTPAGSGEVEATQLSYTERSRAFFKELAINAAVKWKDAFVRSDYDWDRESLNSEEAIDWDNPNDPGAVLHACSTDMIKLWNSTEARKILEIQNLRIEELAGFFLDSLERVTSLRYVPTDDDILRARLKTLGVKEHKFRISSGANRLLSEPEVASNFRVRHFSMERLANLRRRRSSLTGQCFIKPHFFQANNGDREVWLSSFNDVCMITSVTAAWAPYFDDMDAIIFLAPISCFDQVLSEDPSVNRLEDSVHLWKSVVSNKLLKNTNLILFLNKIDIMKMKLNAGIRMADYILSYGNRANDYERASGYLRRKFNTILKEYSPTPRMFYGHLTTVTDTKSTKIILLNLREMLLRQHLAQTSLIQ